MVGIYYKIFNDYYNFLIFKIVVSSLSVFTISHLQPLIRLSIFPTKLFCENMMPFTPNPREFNV